MPTLIALKQLNQLQLSGFVGTAGSGYFLPLSASGNMMSNVVYVTGDQTINGVKNFIDGIQGPYINAAGSDSVVSVQDQQIYSADGGYVSIDWGQRRLLDVSENYSIHWNNRTLLNQYNSVTVNWNDKVLFDTVVQKSIDWGERILYTSDGLDYYISIDWQNRVLYDSSSNNFASLDWDSRVLLANNLIVVDWGNLILNDEIGNSVVKWNDKLLTSELGYATLDWNNSILQDTSERASLDWKNRQVYDGAYICSIDWSGRQLSGNWQTNTKPTLSGHIVNLGYVTGHYLSGSGNATPPSNTVTPASWMDVWVSGVKYKTPLYL